ncbi:MAG TPA: cupin domain-containing protein [Steroidobacteraceae bacterium]|jgi:uncharacterized cupin superfamily protein
MKVIKSIAAAPIGRVASIPRKDILAESEVSPIQTHCEVIHASDQDDTKAYLWHCTPGRFNWFYGCDEDVQVLEGRATFYDMRRREHYSAQAGDVIFFEKGDMITWTIEEPFKKLAVLRPGIPMVARLAKFVWDLTVGRLRLKPAL